jgi:DNA replication and repair protein RecF
MASIARLSINGLRNLRQTEIQPGPGINLIFGANGAGKTSILEALYLLGVGRSFRNHQIRPVISEDTTRLTVFAETSLGDSIGMERTLNGASEIRWNGKAPASLAELSYALPVQLINTDTLDILEGGPQERRRFLDWGVFHVEHAFLPAWRKARVALRQRNALLKAGAQEAEIRPWSLALVQAADDIEVFRRQYLQLLSAEFRNLLSTVDNLPESLGGAKAITLEYRCGWNQDSGLALQLQQCLERDRRQGFTSVGPHRADLAFRVGGKDLSGLFSRGQLKLLVSLLKIAQSRLLRTATGKQSIFLVDDLPAELDETNRSFVCSQLMQLGTQVFLTSIELEPLNTRLMEEVAGQGVTKRLFHVKHGTISAYSPD